MNLSDRAVGGSLGRGQVSIQRSQMSALTVTELLLRTSNIQHYPGDQGHQGHHGHPTKLSGQQILYELCIAKLYE